MSPRHTALVLILLGAGLAAGACGPPDPFAAPHQGEAGPGGVGAACDVDADCEAELVCVQDLPGGFCTMECDWTCPEGSLCVKSEFSVGLSFWACAPLCDDEVSCRHGYSCEPVADKQICSF